MSCWECHGVSQNPFPHLESAVAPLFESWDILLTCCSLNADVGFKPNVSSFQSEQTQSFHKSALCNGSWVYSCSGYIYDFFVLNKTEGLLHITVCVQGFPPGNVSVVEARYKTKHCVFTRVAFPQYSYWNWIVFSMWYITVCHIPHLEHRKHLWWTTDESFTMSRRTCSQQLTRSRELSRR